MTQRTALQAMDELTRKAEVWTMTCINNQVLVSVTAPDGTIGVSGPTMVEALNAAIVRLRAARELGAKGEAAA
jgi:hypothetical protein